jgi:hypothetical protein
MLKKSFISFSLSVGLLLSAAADAETYYKWVDDNNVTHYTTHPPKGRGSVEIQASGGHSEPPPPSYTRSVQDEAPESSQSSDPNLAAVKPTKDPAVCERARANLKTLQEHARIRQKDAYGEVKVLSEEEKAAEIKRASDAVKTHC